MPKKTTKKTAKKAATTKAPQSTGIKRETVEVALSQIRIPAENPARSTFNMATVEKYKNIIADYIDELKDHDDKEHDGTESKPKFPLPRPKVKQIETDENGCTLEVIGGSSIMISIPKQSRFRVIGPVRKLVISQ